MKLKKYPPNALFFRQAMCEATTGDGRKVEVSANVSGDALIAMVYKDGKHLSTYLLTARDFITEALNCEDGEVEFDIAERPSKKALETTQEIKHERLGPTREDTP